MQVQRNFYKEFGRPVAKVFFMAVFTYQFVYFFWAKLEKDEIVKEKEGMFAIYFPTAPNSIPWHYFMSNMSCVGMASANLFMTR